MNDSTADKIISAYRTSPIQTGLLLLLIGVTVGFGWYQMHKDAQVAAFIKSEREKLDAKDGKIEALNEQLLDAVRECRPAK
jgi:hypothetical protein